MRTKDSVVFCSDADWMPGKACFRRQHWFLPDHVVRPSCFRGMKLIWRLWVWWQWEPFRGSFGGTLKLVYGLVTGDESAVEILEYPSCHCIIVVPTQWRVCRVTNRKVQAVSHCVASPLFIHRSTNHDAQVWIFRTHRKPEVLDDIWATHRGRQRD